MKSKLLIFVLLPILLFSTACNKTKVKDVRFALVLQTDVVNDKDEMAALSSGAEMVASRLGIAAPVFSDTSALGFKQKVGQLIADGYNFIAMHAPHLTIDMQSIVQQNQGVRFILLNDTLPANYPNLYHGRFRLEEPAFLAGYMAAYWADVQVGVDLQKSGTVGLVGGDSLHRSDKVYALTFANGVDQYNKSNHRAVKLLQRWTGDNQDSAAAAQAVENMAAREASVFIGIGNRMQTGVFAQVKTLNLFAFGLHVDKAFLYSDYGPHLITSVVAATDVLLFNAVNQARYYDAPHGRYNADLSTGYVGLSRMTHFEGRFPPAVMQQVFDLQKLIQRGLIDVKEPVTPNL